MKQLFAKLIGHRAVDPEVLNAYRAVLPRKLTYQSEESGGKVVIRVTSIDDVPVSSKTLLITEVDQQEDPVPMVNDLIMTYKDIPVELRRYYEKELVLDSHTKNHQTVLVRA